MDEEYATQVKVPQNRVAVVIGKKGITKTEIEEATSCKLAVNTEDNLVSISGDDPMMVYTVQQIVKAIARGFNPKKALLLLKGDFVLEIIELRNYIKKEHMKRVKGRIIGEEGKCRNAIELHTESYISVYGKTVCVIGRAEGAALAKHAILDIIHGSPHANVYKWLEKKRAELRTRDYSVEDYVKEEYKNDN
jgi:ribosomal RNA assembly protein